MVNLIAPPALLCMCNPQNCKMSAQDNPGSAKKITIAERRTLALDLLDIGDKYLDGLLVAERLGVPLDVINLSAKEVRKAPVLLRKVVS